MINYKTYSYEENEHLYGPGKRLLLFTQGCSLRCKGCVNQHLWQFGVGAHITVEEVLELCQDVEGITLHGGEPLDQSEGILEVVKALKNAGKTVILFTGYQYKELSKLSQKRAWGLSDLVISGRYVESKRNIYDPKMESAIFLLKIRMEQVSTKPLKSEATLSSSFFDEPSDENAIKSTRFTTLTSYSEGRPGLTFGLS